MTKQVIVVNKGLNMTKGKMSAQVSHAAMAFLTKEFLIHPDSRYKQEIYDQESGELIGYNLNMVIDLDSYDWLTSSYTKVICQVKSEKELEKVVKKAIDNGFVEDKDFFKIIDNGYTEFNNQKTWTCIGFRPMESEKIDKVTKRLQLFRED